MSASTLDVFSHMYGYETYVRECRFNHRHFNLRRVHFLRLVMLQVRMKDFPTHGTSHDGAETLSKLVIYFAEHMVHVPVLLIGTHGSYQLE